MTTTIACTRRPGTIWPSCRCPDCVAVRNRNLKLHRSGRLPVVDQRPAAVRRLKGWIARGYSARAITEMTGLPNRTIQKQLRGNVQVEKMQHKTATAILTAPDVPTGGGWVPAIGCVRRLRALTVNGWSMHALSERCSIGEGTLAALRDDKHRVTRPRFAREVSRVYDELWDVPGPGKLAGTRARNRGWLPPLAWDDESIDDPKATPYVATPTSLAAGYRRSEDTAEDVAWFLAEHPHATAGEVAERLHMAKDGLGLALKRAGRQDLRDRLAANAATASSIFTTDNRRSA